ncbi:hypothetical protein [Methylobacterium sp. WL6]|uniref:hypothetical protein n=1 Tax=Methylobacterium sp. WL6 TaxID=2603901 RepID=UPI0011CC21FB|nr:hypothetical protein [Methylobacterium sp. WL6]TXN68457.1 hypothetical protein FV230_12875 [Methylobacterium sp. WL6]
MNLGKIFEFFGKAFLIGAALTSFGSAIYLCYVDKVAGATLCAALFGANLLFYYFPQLESFKAIGVEAKLRQRLDEAAEILQNIKALAAVSAQQTYYQLGWGNRMASASERTKSGMAEETNKVLEKLGFTNAERKKLQDPYIRFISVDIYYIISHIVGYLLREKSAEARTEAQSIFGSNVVDQSSPKYGRYVELNDYLSKIDSSHMRLEDKLEDPSILNLRELLEDDIPYDILTEREAQIIRKISNEASTIFEACKDGGRLTLEAERFTSRVEGVDSSQAIYEKYFGKKMSFNI